MSPTNRSTDANTRTAAAAAQLMVMPHALQVVLKPDIPWTLFGPYALDRKGPPRTGPPPTFNGLGR
jgi:hypothetical protein